MLDIVAQDIVAYDMRGLAERMFEPIQSLPDVSLRRNNGRPVPEPHRRHVENLGGLGMDFQIDR